MPKELRPHKGPQELFLSTDADIAIYGGAAGGGKSYALLMEGARFSSTPGFTGVIFRKTYGDITNPMCLWDQSVELYMGLGGLPKASSLKWKWSSGSVIQFSHFQYEKNKHNWQGSQLAFIGWDELTHFSRSIFFYMLSRNRSTCGVRPYIRCTCNPDPDSWVREFIDWWIGPDGYPIPERSGVIRWFYRDGDKVVWHDKRSEIPKEKRIIAKSVTFIAARLEDNPTLMKADPDYIGNLLSLPFHEKERLYGGNWNVRLVPGSYFHRSKFLLVDEVPQSGRVVRFWDRAATEPNENNPDPDWTAGVKLRKAEDGFYYVEDVVSLRGNPHMVRTTIRNTAAHDGLECKVLLEQEPGSSGKSDVDILMQWLEGYDVASIPPRGRKEVRAGPVSTHAGAGYVRVKRADWNAQFFAVLEGFPLGPHDDEVDGLSGAFNYLAIDNKTPRARMLA